MIHQPVLFPLHSILRDPDGEARCGCGWVECSRVGKHPEVKWAELEYDPDAHEHYSSNKSWIGATGQGLGMKTGAPPRGSDVIFIDLDGDAACNAWEDLGGFDGDTHVVQTGRGPGYLQLAFQHPGFPVKNSVSALAPGIDIRGDGGFVVVAGSPHRSGRRYELLDDSAPAPCPAWLLEWLRAQRGPAPIQKYDGDVTDPDELEYRRSLYTRYLETTPDVRSEANRGRGDALLFNVVQYGAYDLALPTEDVLELVAEHYDPRCDRAWGAELEERVLHKAHTAKTSSTRARIEPLPDPKKDPELAALFAPVDLDPNTLDLSDVAASVEREKKAKSRKTDGIQWGSWGDPVDPPTWLVQGLIPIETVGMFVAIGSSLKTFCAVDIGVAIATGQPWLGRYPVRQGKVVIVDWESGLFELRRRVRLLHPDGDIENLGVWVMPGPQIDDPELWKTLARVEGLQLVILDSLAAGAPTVDENSKEAAIPLAMAGKISEACGIASLFVHHTTKSDGGGDARKTVRGSSAIFAACDWAYSFENVDEVSDDEGGAVRRMKMSCIKPCQSARPAPVQIQLADSTGLTWFEEDGAAEIGAARAGVAKGERSAESIQAAIKLVLTPGPIKTKEKLARAVGANDKVVYRELADLLAGREVYEPMKGVYALDSPELRTRRVLDLVRQHPYHTTEAKLAAMAFVDTRDVAELVMVGRLVRSAEGKWLEVAGK